MSEQPERSRTLRRKKTEPAAPPVKPADLVYAAVAYLGVLYECQMTYVKHELEKPRTADQDQLVETLEALHNLSLQIMTRVIANEPVDPDRLNEILEQNGRVIARLAEEGKHLVSGIKRKGIAP